MNIFYSCCQGRMLQILTQNTFMTVASSSGKLALKKFIKKNPQASTSEVHIQNFTKATSQILCLQITTSTDTNFGGESSLTTHCFL